MEQHYNSADPREIVEVYRHPPAREIVETYSRPLPESVLEREEEEYRLWKRRRNRRNFVVFLLCLLAVVSLAAAAWFWPWEKETAPPAVNPGTKEASEITIAAHPTAPEVIFRVADQGTEPVTIQEVYQQVNPAVVTVMVELGESGGYSQMSVGTGVIFTSDGYIITNHHILEGGAYCTVATDSGEIYQASYVAGDSENDLAVLKIDGKDFPAAAFADSNDLQVGDTVYAIGNPLGVELRGTLTDGIVSAINRDVWVGNHTMTLIQTNAALNEGNSGGPLINCYGQVVGINVVKMVSRGQDASVEGLGFAIPSASAERIVNDLLHFGVVQPKVSLGLQVLRASETLSDGTIGIMVQSADEGGAAEAAGIQTGDYIIRAGGLEIHSSDDLLLARDRYYFGEEFPVTVWRAGEILEFTLKLERNTTE